MVVKSLENFTRHQDNYYNRILQLIANKEILNTIEKFIQDVIAAGDFCIRVPYDKLNDIISSNEMKNQIELKSGRTRGGAEVRIEATKLLFNSNTSQMVDKDYPKYGYIGCKNKRLEYFSEMSDIYGDVILTLKKENLLDRTTVCIGDSINFKAAQYLIPTLVNNVKATCIKGLDQNNQSSNIHSYYAFYQAIVEKRITLDNFYNIYEIFDAHNGFEFFELQFHGPIIFDQDIAQIDCFTPLDNIDKTALESKGIKVNA